VQSSPSPSTRETLPMRAASLLALSLCVILLPAADAPADESDRILKLFMDEFVELTPGKGKFPASFKMGSADEDAPAAEKPVVTVTFARPFAIAKYEVTQELWSVVTGKNASRWKGKRNSVEMMDWNDAVSFCEKATAMLHKKKLLPADEVIRLPSEAEWEY